MALWKKLLLALVKIAAVVVLAGGLLLFFIMFASLAGWPPYLQRALWVLCPVVLAGAAAAASGLLSTAWKRGVWLMVLAVFAGCLLYVGHGLWRDSVPTVDDRSLLLIEYEPFREGSKTAELEEPASIHFEETDVWNLTMDGATALYPVYAAFAQAVFPEQLASGYHYYNSTVRCTGTVEAYQRLIDREVDLIFAAAPSQAQLDAAAAAGVELHLTPIGKEAFVFFVNSKNPVTDLSVEQIQGIYSGAITNWREVGGDSQSIRPFQRMENSGSQSALERLMAGLPLLEPEMEDRVASMGGIIQEVASYRNYKNAIGFSFRFYATEMVSSSDIRLLALDGIPPTQETIQDGTYPLASEFYVVTASLVGQPPPQEQDPILAEFLAWILSEQGQYLVEKTGYVPVLPPL